MSAASHASPDPELVRLRRHWRSGLGSLWRFLGGSGGLDDAFEGMFALAGPTVQQELELFARDDVGRALLAERPRRDLNELLADRAALAAMPPDSFAAAYLDYMGGEGMGTSDAFLSAAGLEEKAARFGWSEDQLWFVRRLANSHDLFHILSGYGRDIVGEIGVNSFTAGQIPLLPLKLLLVYMALLKPSRPIQWLRFMARAFRQGRRPPNLACVDYEAMLPLPLAEARRRIGLRPSEEVHPEGLPEAGRLLRRLEGNIEAGA